MDDLWVDKLGNEMDANEVVLSADWMVDAKVDYLDLLTVLNLVGLKVVHLTENWVEQSVVLSVAEKDEH